MMVGLEPNRFEQPEPSTTNVLNGIGKAILYHLLASPELEPPYRKILRSNPSRPNTQANAHSCSVGYIARPKARLSGTAQ
jgi:hypothetical protein